MIWNKNKVCKIKTLHQKCRIWPLHFFAEMHVRYCFSLVSPWPSKHRKDKGLYVIGGAIFHLTLFLCVHVYVCFFCCKEWHTLLLSYTQLKLLYFVEQVNYILITNYYIINTEVRLAGIGASRLLPALCRELYFEAVYI